MNFDWIKNVGWGTALIWSVLILIGGYYYTINYQLFVLSLILSLGLSGLISFLFNLIFKQTIPYLFATIVIALSLPKKDSMKLLLFKSLETILGKKDLHNILIDLGIDIKYITEKAKSERVENQQNRSDDQDLNTNNKVESESYDSDLGSNEDYLILKEFVKERKDK